MKKTEKLKVPTCQTLLKPPTIAGISREIFVLNFASTLCFIVIFESVLMIIFGLILHLALYFFTKKDPLILTIFLNKITLYKYSALKY